MAFKLDTQNKLNKLPIRHEPFWDILGKGKALGYRKSATGGVWKARLRQPDGKKIGRTLGDDLTFEQAKTLAEDWFVSISGAGDHRYTLAQAVEDYLNDYATRTSRNSSNEARSRLNKHLPESMLKTLVLDITSTQIESWHRGMVKDTDDEERLRKSRVSANRTLSSLKAVLNRAFKKRRKVTSDAEWKVVAPFKDVNKARIIFLTDAQVTRLMDNTTGGFNQLVTAAILTGARYGELSNATVADFDKNAGTIEFDGKTGRRTTALSDEATTFFKKVTRNKLPTALLLSKDDGSAWGKGHVRDLWPAARIAARLPDASVFYSLRHYNISKTLLSGGATLAIAQNTGTSIAMIEKYYGKFLISEKKKMMNQVALGL